MRLVVREADVAAIAATFDALRSERAELRRAQLGPVRTVEEHLRAQIPSGPYRIGDLTLSAIRWSTHPLNLHPHRAWTALLEPGATPECSGTLQRPLADLHLEAVQRTTYEGLDARQSMIDEVLNWLPTLFRPPRYLGIAKAHLSLRAMDGSVLMASTQVHPYPDAL